MFCGDVGGRDEVLGVHVVEYAGVELPAFRIFGCLFQVAHHHEEAPFAHLELEDESQLVVSLDVVDDLDDGELRFEI